MSMARGSNDDVLVGCSKKRKKKISTEATSDDLYSHKKWPPIKIGDKIDLLPLLFTQHRNYLIKSNGERVQANELEGKVIVLYFLKSYTSTLYTSTLVDLHKELHPKGCFEVVLTAVTSKRELNSTSKERRFQKIFSSLPWPAIPFSDLESRKNIENRFRIPYSFLFPACYVIDPEGVVLNLHASWDIIIFGAPGYPFSHKKLNLLRSEDNAARKNPSITTLLTSTERDYVISNERGRVPVSDLEDKTVALYFYDESAPDRDRLSLTSRLEKAYRKLAKKRNFEIVLVYVHHTLNTYKCTSQVSFQRRFKTMPWLALPFGDPTYKKLKRLFNYPNELGPNALGDVVPHPTLVIIGPHGKFVEPFGEDVFSWYGTAAYPFTRESAAKIEAEEAEMLRLEMLCKDQNMFFKQKDGTKDLFSQLVGKRTILVVGSELLEYYADFFSRLQARYLNMKGTNDEFEVIHITFAKQGSPYDKHVADTPWPVAHFAMDSDEKKLICLSSGILGFDSDGKLVMRTIRPSFEWAADMDFPFHARTLEEDALIVLEDVHGWDSSWDNTSDTSDEEV